MCFCLVAIFWTISVYFNTDYSSKTEKLLPSQIVFHKCAINICLAIVKKTIMSSRPVNYSKLTRAQVDILEKYFENGMKSTMCSQQIEKAAEQTSLPVEKIKVFLTCSYYRKPRRKGSFSLLTRNRN